MDFSKTVLDNGISVVTEKMPGARSAALGFWVRTGSRDEVSSTAGISHFMEHMLFKGTPSRSAIDISMAFDALGADLNAFTTREHTCFYVRAMEENVAPCFEILADMLANSSFAPEMVDLEREVVLEEIAACEDAPDDFVFDLSSQALFSGQALGAPILGSKEIVSGFSSEDLHRYHKENYVTGNLVVAAAGSVDHEQIVQLAAEFLGGLKQAPRKTRSTGTASDFESLAVLERDCEQAHLVVGLRTYDALSPKRFALQLAESALGGGMSSRLFNEIREKRGLAYAVYTMTQLFEGAGQFQMYAGTRPENLEKTLQLAYDEFEKLARGGISEEEYLRVRQMVCGNYVLSMESPQNHMIRLGKMESNQMELTSVDETVEKYKSVTLHEVNEAASELLSGAVSVAVIGPYSYEQIERMTR